MKVTLLPSSISGTIQAIASKSFAHRQLICSSLADRETEIVCSNLSDDIRATMGCLVSLGAYADYLDGSVIVTPIASIPPEALLDCGESGSTYRFLVPLAAAFGVRARFLLRGRLPERPMWPMWENLEGHGMSISGMGKSEVTLSGRLSGGSFILPGDVSSQFISGLLMAMPLIRGEKRIEIKDKVESAGYINMTIDVLRSFGIKVRKEGNAITMSEGEKFSSPGVTVTEGDWSNSAFWLCGAAASGQEVTCRGLNMDSSQGDAAIAGILRDMGADVECSGSSVRVKAAGLKGIEIDAGDIPDLVPAIALAACTAEGVTRITNAGRLRVKESDRLFTVADTLRKLGADIEEGEDSLSVTGGRRLAGGSVDSHGDHRIVMMAAIASLLSEDSITIDGAGAVNKSYPGFFEDFASLGAEVRKEQP